MRHLTLFFLAILSVTNLCAQKTLFEENFDNKTNLYIGGGWTTSEFTGPTGWQTSEMYNLFCSYSIIPQALFNNKVAAISDCYRFQPPVRNNANVFMYTPGISLNGVITGVVLSYDSYFNATSNSTGTETASIEISTDSGATWTVVQNVAANSSKLEYQHWYVNLSAYKNANKLWVGFRYKDGGGNDMGGWTVDNIRVFEPLQKDAALVSITPEKEIFSYKKAGSNTVHKGEILNLGIDTIYSYDVHHKLGSGTVATATFTRVVPPFTTDTFTHPITSTVLTGKNNFDAWVTVTGDQKSSNDSISGNITGVGFIPQKRVLVEEGTSTQDYWGPRGIVFMDVANNDFDACLVSVHRNDPMEMRDYSDYLHSLGNYYLPYFILDRTTAPDEQSFFVELQERSGYYGYADIQVKAHIASPYLYIDASVIPATDMTGNYKLALVITEDNRSGTTQDWAQNNRYANGTYGPMGGFEKKPSPIPAAEMKYNFVARTGLPDAEGGNYLPSSMQYNQTYTHSFSMPLPYTWDVTKLRAIVMLINADDSTVLNSNKTQFYLEVDETGKVAISEAGLYPNPANDITTLYYQLENVQKVTVSITDISGRVIQQVVDANTVVGKNEMQLPTAKLPVGTYIVSLQTEEGIKALKMQVLH